MIRVLLFLSLLLTGCHTGASSDKRQVQAPGRAAPSAARNASGSLLKPSIVRGPAFVGVIFPAGTNTIPGLPPEYMNLWTPSESDVFAAEGELVPFLKSSKDPRVPGIVKMLEAYKRQYRGIIQGGQKQIAIQFLCETDKDDWANDEMIILDGGSCFFGVRFSTETKTFSALQINGPA